MTDEADGPAALTTEARLLADEVARLAHDRRFYRTAADELEAQQTVFETLHAGLRKRVSDLNSAVGATEKRVRAIAETAFRADGNRHPHPAVEIKMTKVVTVPDATKALDWAIKKGMCLKLDGKALEALAKAAPESVAAIATVREEPRAAIARVIPEQETT